MVTSLWNYQVCQLLILVRVKVGIGIQCGLHGFMPQPVRNLQWGKARFDQHTSVGVPNKIQTFGFYPAPVCQAHDKKLITFLRISWQPHRCPYLLNTVFTAHASYPGSLIPKKSFVTYSISIRSNGKI